VLVRPRAGTGSPPVDSAAGGAAAAGPGRGTLTAGPEGVDRFPGLAISTRGAARGAAGTAAGPARGGGGGNGGTGAEVLACRAGPAAAGAGVAEGAFAPAGSPMWISNPQLQRWR
jgi:hypothetical protein